jgi:hypothetical protein
MTVQLLVLPSTADEGAQAGAAAPAVPVELVVSRMQVIQSLHGGPWVPMPDTVDAMPSLRSPFYLTLAPNGRVISVKFPLDNDERTVVLKKARVCVCVCVWAGRRVGKAQVVSSSGQILTSAQQRSAAAHHLTPPPPLPCARHRHLPTRLTPAGHRVRVPSGAAAR